MNYTNRRARNPLTGRNEVIDGDMTYNEWVESLTPEQKSALELTRKKDANKTADKLQFAEYKERLGTKVTGRSFDKWQEMKYTDPQKYNELKTLYKQANSVDKSAGNGIMKAGSDSLAFENQRYGRNKSTLVNKTYIESGDYRRKFDKISNNQDVNRVLYNKSKEMLRHRSGTMLEDMYWIDGNTGDIIASALNEKINGAVAYSRSIQKSIKGKDNLIAIHTHPQSMPPSITDFNSCYKNNYNMGILLAIMVKYMHIHHMNLSVKNYIISM